MISGRTWPVECSQQLPWSGDQCSQLPGGISTDGTLCMPTYSSNRHEVCPNLRLQQLFQCPSLRQGPRCSSAPRGLWRTTRCRANIPVKIHSTSSPFTNQCSHHHPTRAEQIGLTLVLHVWDAPARRCPAKDQGAIHAMTFLVCTLITWDS